MEQVSGSRDFELPRLAYGLEVLRVRFLIKAYYRARVDKIEKYSAAVLDSPELQAGGRWGAVMGGCDGEL